MSVPNLSNSMIQQQQNIVINQVPLSHAIMTNVNTTNGIPIVNAIQHTNSNDQGAEMKSGGITVVETITSKPLLSKKFHNRIFVIRNCI